MNGLELEIPSSSKRQFGQDEEMETDCCGMARSGPVQATADEENSFVNPFHTSKPARAYTQVEPEEQGEQRKRAALSTGRFQLPVEVVGQLLEAINDAGLSSMRSDTNLGNLALLYASRRQQFFSYLAKLNETGGLERVLYDLTKERLVASSLRSLDQVRLHRVAAITLLLIAGVCPRYVDVDSEKTPLHWAALHGYETVVADMIKHGAYTDAQDKQGITPLGYAQINGRTPICAILSLAGASVY